MDCQTCGAVLEHYNFKQKTQVQICRAHRGRPSCFSVTVCDPCSANLVAKIEATSEALARAKALQWEDEGEKAESHS